MNKDTGLPRASATERSSRESPTLSIGWAQASITPRQPVNLFGMFNERISTHVEDPQTSFLPAGADLQPDSGSLHVSKGTNPLPTV